MILSLNGFSNDLCSVFISKFVCFLMDRYKIHELAQNFRLLSMSLVCFFSLFDRHPFEAFVLVVIGVIVLWMSHNVTLLGSITFSCFIPFLWIWIHKFIRDSIETFSAEQMFILVLSFSEVNQLTFDFFLPKSLLFLCNPSCRMVIWCSVFPFYQQCAMWPDK